jgi:hypothetical protein
MVCLTKTGQHRQGCVVGLIHKGLDRIFMVWLNGIAALVQRAYPGATAAMHVDCDGHRILSEDDSAIERIAGRQQRHPYGPRHAFTRVGASYFEPCKTVA